MKSDEEAGGKARPRDAQATRLALLKAGQRRFGVLGYDRTTTRDIAKDAGVNLALISRYFGGKEGLYQAVLEATPEALLDTTPPRGDIVDQFLESLSPDAWPEFGQHPLVLLLRDANADEQLQSLRSRGMRSAINRIVEWSGIDAGEPGSARRREVELRAQMVHALLCGIVALRSITPVEPIASAEAEELRAALTDAVTALLGA
jgi:AcrR family transcriptional regulator